MAGQYSVMRTTDLNITHALPYLNTLREETKNEVIYNWRCSYGTLSLPLLALLAFD